MGTIHYNSRALLLCLITCAGCGDTSGLDLTHADLSAPAVDAATTADLAIPDDLATPPDLTPPIIIGSACPMGTECGMGYVCLGSHLSATLPPGGFCTKSCVSDSDCGAGAFCGPAVPGVGPICFANCDENGMCAGLDRVCSRRLNGGIDLVKTACLPGNSAAKDGDPCTTFGDCNRNQTCASNPFENPGGQCVTVGCTPGDATTCSPAPNNQALCFTAAPGLNLCAPTCMQSQDCRAADLYACIPLTKMANPPLICAYPHAGPGAACAIATDCAGNGGALWQCLTGVAFPGGYCSGALGTCDPANTDTCPNNSSCYDPTPNLPHNGDQYCAGACASDADCRKADGYSCQVVEQAGMVKGCVF